MNAVDEAELSFNDFLIVVRKWKWAILVVVVIATATAAVASYVLPKKYAAVVLISPVSNSDKSGLLSGFNSLVSQVSGLASLAGISSQSSDSSKAEALAVLESEVLTEKYIRDNDLLPILYPQDWDAKNHRWISSDPTKIPTLWQANAYFKKKIRKVAADPKSSLVTLTITWTNPTVAAKWANDLVAMTNEFQRSKAITESERNIAYLTSEVVKTDVVGVKQAIYSILQSEISKSMLARGNQEYALKIIDPAVPPERPSSPQPLYWILAAFFGSSAICMGAAFLGAALARKKP